ncbi:LytR/AlgR family response regulator transcription factor [Pelosinus sp. sgz500959]|uniref:LytR/AlgR family response regulator transcription factor n=1 Tax=Pelosinus sp. sgz500959 TaxID=3242472 RepID=UPI00366C2C19
MISIGVCDDNHTDRTQVCNAIEDYIQTHRIDGKVFVFDCAEKLISAIGDKKLHFDIIFLDIIMGDMDGMTCARWIRQQDKLIQIIFLTSSTDYVYEGYEVNATAYLVKPVNMKKLTVALDKTIAEIKDVMKESIAISRGGVTQRILTTDILYLESQKNKVNIVLARTKERIAVYTTLDEFVQYHQSKMWIRSHKSYVVNFLYIEQYVSDKFILRDGTVIPISRIHKEKARECFFILLHNQ